MACRAHRAGGGSMTKISLPVGGWVAVSRSALARKASSGQGSVRERIEAAALSKLGRCRCATFAVGELGRLVGASRQSVHAAIKGLVQADVLADDSVPTRLVVSHLFADANTGAECVDCRLRNDQLVSI